MHRVYIFKSFLQLIHSSILTRMNQSIEVALRRFTITYMEYLNEEKFIKIVK